MTLCDQTHKILLRKCLDDEKGLCIFLLLKTLDIYLQFHKDGDSCYVHRMGGSVNFVCLLGNWCNLDTRVV